MIVIEPVSALTPGVLVSSNVPETDYPVHNPLTLYITGDRFIDPAAHLVYESIVGSTAVVTLGIVSPGQVTWPAHAQAVNTPVILTTTGALPTGVTAGVTYYIKTVVSVDVFTVSATPGGAAINFTGAQSGVHTAKASNNVGKAAPDTTYWNPKGYTNRYKMLDEFNNTQTTNPDSILLTLAPGQVVQGVYCGNLEATEVVITMTDPIEGVVFTATESLVVADSGSSFFRWFFNALRRKTYFVSVQMPVYYSATVTIEIKNPGGVAKCGMCVVGRLLDVGLSQVGLGTDIKDYSSTTFNFDGTSKSVLRGYSKRMNIDVDLDNQLIDSVQENLARLRGTSVVWVGATMYGSAILFGKYSSFKNIIKGLTYSQMSLQIEGTV